MRGRTRPCEHRTANAFSGVRRHAIATRPQTSGIPIASTLVFENMLMPVGCRSAVEWGALWQCVMP
jgi:hypothetical protein